jgi:SAM-dependent methyltransferase
MSPVPDPRSADDTSFDLLYPRELRARSSRYWTPVEVARTAARLFRRAGARDVLDVGAGVGKFALAAAAAAPELRFAGIEQRPHLVELARVAAERLELTNVRFQTGDATRVPWQPFDGLYFFNPFAENLYDGPARFDDRVELTRDRFIGDVLRVEAALRAAPLGTAFVTYHGMGGRIPSSYDLEQDVLAHSDRLRLWVKRRASDDGSFYLELDDCVSHWRPGALGAGLRELVLSSRFLEDRVKEST